MQLGEGAQFAYNNPQFSDRILCVYHFQQQDGFSQRAIRLRSSALGQAVSETAASSFTDGKLSSSLTESAQTSGRKLGQLEGRKRPAPENSDENAADKVKRQETEHPQSQTLQSQRQHPQGHSKGKLVRTPILKLHVNSLMLAASSEYFRNAIERWCPPGKDLELTVAEGEEKAVEKFIKYLYTNKLETRRESELLQLVRLADRTLTLPCLKDCCFALSKVQLSLPAAAQCLLLAATLRQDKPFLHLLWDRAAIRLKEALAPLVALPEVDRADAEAKAIEDEFAGLQPELQAALPELPAEALQAVFRVEEEKSGLQEAVALSWWLRATWQACSPAEWVGLLKEAITKFKRVLPLILEELPKAGWVVAPTGPTASPLLVPARRRIVALHPAAQAFLAACMGKKVEELPCREPMSRHHLTKFVASVLPQHGRRRIRADVFVTFWMLTAYDIYQPAKRTIQELQQVSRACRRMQQALHDATHLPELPNVGSALEGIQSRASEQLAFYRRQQRHAEQVREALKQQAAGWPAAMYGLTREEQACFARRIVAGPGDAVCCAHFLALLPSLGLHDPGCLFGNARFASPRDFSNTDMLAAWPVFIAEVISVTRLLQAGAEEGLALPARRLLAALMRACVALQRRQDGPHPQRT